MPRWFAKILSFIRLDLKNIEHEETSAAAEICLASASRREAPSTAFCFVQSYEVLNGRTLNVNVANRTVDCTRVRWQQNTGVSGFFKSREVYRLISLNAIRGKVHIIRFEEVVNVVSLHEKQEKGTNKTY